MKGYRYEIISRYPCPAYHEIRKYYRIGLRWSIIKRCYSRAEAIAYLRGMESRAARRRRQAWECVKRWALLLAAIAAVFTLMMLHAKLI